MTSYRVFPTQRNREVNLCVKDRPHLTGGESETAVAKYKVHCTRELDTFTVSILDKTMKKVHQVPPKKICIVNNSTQCNTLKIQQQILWPTYASIYSCKANI
jgi:hypothetical protein